MERMINLNQLSELLLITGADVPFPEGALTIHQPKMKEIALIGEESFLTGVELLKFDKTILTKEEQQRLAQFSSFDILINILLDQQNAVTTKAEDALMVLQLLFPNYQLRLQLKEIEFYNLNGENKIGGIHCNNFEAFQLIIKQLFSFKEEASKLNPTGTLAKRIADKLAERQRKLASQRADKGEKKKIAIYSRYISILAVGEQKDINDFANYTVFQLLDEFTRYQLKMASDIYYQARLAGASSSDMKQPEDWMKDLYP